MAKFIAAAKGFVKGEEGATMVEYALMVALIAVFCITACHRPSAVAFRTRSKQSSPCCNPHTDQPTEPDGLWG